MTKLFGREYHWILKGKTPVAINDVLAWGKWFETADRTVKKTEIQQYEVSTVFLGLDHQFSMDEDALPLLFETMVFENLDEPVVSKFEFNGRLIRKEYDKISLEGIDGYMMRYSTWGEAEAGHEAIVALVRRSLMRVVNGGHA